jgi:hypothetical protein
MPTTIQQPKLLGRGGGLYSPSPQSAGQYTFVNPQAIRLPSSGEKRNDFVLKDLKVNPADVADIFMVPTSQLLCLEFFVEP